MGVGEVIRGLHGRGGGGKEPDLQAKVAARKCKSEGFSLPSTVLEQWARQENNCIFRTRLRLTEAHCLTQAEENQVGRPQALRAHLALQPLSGAIKACPTLSCP